MIGLSGAALSGSTSLGARCDWSGASNGDLHPVTGSLFVLTVAHVFDRLPEASHLFNLAALCQRCHKQHDVKDRAQGKGTGSGPSAEFVLRRPINARFRTPVGEP